MSDKKCKNVSKLNKKCSIDAIEDGLCVRHLNLHNSTKKIVLDLSDMPSFNPVNAIVPVSNIKNTEIIPISNVKDTPINTIKKVFNGKELTCIQNQDNIWFKGKDVALILEYKDTKQAIRDNVQTEDKLFLENIHQLGGVQSTPLKFGGVQPTPLTYNEKNTIYINESGLYSLVFNSKMPQAKSFKKWVTSDVLPNLRKHGSYIIPATITENTKPSVYLNQNVSSFHNKNVIYVAYIGKHNDELLYKYGISSRIFVRDYAEHRKAFDVFDLIYIAETDNNAYIETQFQNELKVRNIHRCLSVKNKKYTELFTVNNHFTIDILTSTLDDFIANKPLPALSDAHNKIKQLIENIEFSKFELEYQYKIKIEDTKIKIEDTKQKEIEYKMTDNYKTELQIQLLQLQHKYN